MHSYERPSEVWKTGCRSARDVRPAGGQRRRWSVAFLGRGRPVAGTGDPATCAPFTRLGNDSGRGAPRPDGDCAAAALGEQLAETDPGPDHLGGAASAVHAVAHVTADSDINAGPTDADRKRSLHNPLMLSDRSGDEEPPKNADDQHTGRVPRCRRGLSPKRGGPSRASPLCVSGSWGDAHFVVPDGGGVLMARMSGAGSRRQAPAPGRVSRCGGTRRRGPRSRRNGR